MNALVRKVRRWLLMYAYRTAGLVSDCGLGAPSPILGAAGGAAAGTGALITAAGGAALAGPIGAAVGAALALLGVLGVGGGCGQSCIAASNDANAVEVALKANLAAFLAGQISQSQAMANYQALLLQLEQGCSEIGGSAGQNCIADRQAGACKWQTSPGGWDEATCTYTAPGAAGSGSSCWNWQVGYSDPISLAPSCFTSRTAGAGSGTVTGALVGAVPAWLWFVAGGLVLAEVFS